MAGHAPEKAIPIAMQRRARRVLETIGLEQCLVNELLIRYLPGFITILGERTLFRQVCSGAAYHGLRVVASPIATVALPPPEVAFG